MNYKPDDATFTADAYTVDGWDAGLAWYVWGWETEPDEDTEWTGLEVHTGRVVVTMVGDDREFAVDPEDVTPIEPDSFCRSCGQIGCGHNVYA